MKDPDAIALAQIAHAGTDRGNDTGAIGMRDDARKFHFRTCVGTPLVVRGVDAGSMQPHQNFVLARLRPFHLAKGDDVVRRARSFVPACVHRFWLAHDARACSASSLSTCRSTAGERTGCGKASRRAARPFCSSEPFRIGADATPVAVSGAKQFCRIKPAGVGVVCIHVVDNAGLGSNEIGGVVKIGEDVGWRQIDDAAEPATRCAASSAMR